MSVPVLNRKQQKKTLSAKCKNIKKNVLAPPNNLKVSYPEVNQDKLAAISLILDRLLPSARLPKCQRLRNSDCVECSEKVDSDCHLKRNQLLIGVNSVSKGVSNGSADCVLLADDIQPKLLISHLLILCSLKNIPYIFVPKFREQTEKALGFSCIVLGFKKNCNYFLEAVNLIKSAVDNVSDIPCVEKQEGIEETGLEEKTQSESCYEKDKVRCKFSYLIRMSNSNRVFVPESSTKHNKTSIEFISLGTEESTRKKLLKNEFNNKKKAQNIGKKHFKKMIQNKSMISFGNGKKKFNMKYAATEIMKMGPNPKREKKKFSNLQTK